MASSLELNEVLGEITHGLVRELDAALARSWLLRADALHLVSSAGLSERVDGAHARVAVGALEIGQIAASRTPTTSHDLGETGTGKELFARAVHDGSSRRTGPLVKANRDRPVARPEAPLAPERSHRARRARREGGVATEHTLL